MEHDFDRVLRHMELLRGETFDDKGHADKDFGEAFARHFDTIRFALRFTKAALGGGYSNDVLSARSSGAGGQCVSSQQRQALKAKLLQIAKEVGNG